MEVLGLDPADVQLEYTGGDRGWKGDVPVVRLDTTKIKATGWRCSRPTRRRCGQSLEAMLDDASDSAGERRSRLPRP